MAAGKKKHQIYTRNALRHLRALLTRHTFDGIFILCDAHTHSACLPLLVQEVPETAQAEVIEVESGESSKVLEVCAGIWQTLAEQSATRNSLLINLGGGVVCDMGGFCAAVYKRGMPFVHVPTSLLAMADAAIGGKTGVDLGSVKNVIGVFAAPLGVFIAPAFLQTLPDRHLLNGFAEMLKIALAHDKALFRKLSRKGIGYRTDEMISKAVALKVRIVSRDPFDKHVRKSLNLGHTLGHAIESYALENNHDLLHGEAVAAGMIAESVIARNLGIMKPGDFKEIVSALTSFYPKLPFKVSYKSLERFLLNDKKRRQGNHLFALPVKPGKCAIDVPVKSADVETALREYYKSCYAKARIR